jgi:hypothetical protein
MPKLVIFSNLAKGFCDDVLSSLKCHEVVMLFNLSNTDRSDLI